MQMHFIDRLDAVRCGVLSVRARLCVRLCVPGMENEWRMMAQTRTRRFRCCTDADGWMESERERSERCERVSGLLVAVSDQGGYIIPPAL